MESRTGISLALGILAIIFLNAGAVFSQNLRLVEVISSCTNYSYPSACSPQLVSVTATSNSCIVTTNQAWPFPSSKPDVVATRCFFSSFGVGVSANSIEGPTSQSSLTPQSGIPCVYTQCNYFTYFALADSSSLPQCSDFLPVSLPDCEGGQGILLSGNELQLDLKTAELNLPSPPADWFDRPIPNQNDTALTRPDGSVCEFYNVSGQKLTRAICPLGFTDEPDCEETPNHPKCYNQDCDQFPDLPECQQSSSSAGESSSDSNGGGSSGSEGNGSSGSGDVSCLDLNNCDWARIDVQLIQLGVEEGILDAIRDARDLLQAGYNLERDQLGALEGLINAVGDGDRNIAGAVNGGTRDIVGAIDGLRDALGGSGNGIADGVSDGLGQFAGDSTGQGALDGLIDGFGEGSGGNMGDSLGDGTGARNKIRNAVGVKGEDFAFFGSSSNCPVWDMSFDSGFMGVACHNCRIDLCNIYGFNAGQTLKAIVWLIVLASTLFMNLEILRTGGRS